MSDLRFIVEEKGKEGMVLPFLKLGTLALKTLSKPVASRLKKQAGLHPRFREFIVNIAQVVFISFSFFSSHFSSFSFLLHKMALKLLCLNTVCETRIPLSLF